MTPPKAIFVDLETCETDSSEGSGLRTPLKSSVLEAAGDSYVHHRLQRCHPGTRQRYLAKLAQWSVSNTIRAKRIAWVCGPPGVGKSALARSCVEVLGTKLGASFFFSRVNHTNSPNVFFTSISQQLALKDNHYADVVDPSIGRDPGSGEKSLQQQFFDLFVFPLRILKDEGKIPSEFVIIIDGLDECVDEIAQETIVDVITRSVRDRSTPFRWLFFGRPEPQLLIAFDSPSVQSCTLQLEMAITRDLDNELDLFMMEGLRGVGQKYGLPLSWPSKRDIRALLDLSSGSFIHASAAIQFIDQPNNPEDNLRAILRLPRLSTQSHPTRPLCGLHQLYSLVMKRIPAELLLPTQRVLLAGILGMSALSRQRLLSFANISKVQFERVCVALNPFIRVEDERAFLFYHSSFMDFLGDRASSEDFCILDHPAIALRTELLSRLKGIHSVDLVDYESDRSLGQLWPAYKSAERATSYQDLVNGFFKLCYLLPFDDQIASALVDFSFDKLCIFGELTLDFDGMPSCALETIIEKMPESLRSKIVHPIRDRSLLSYGIDRTYGARLAQPTFSYILGRRNNKAFFWCNRNSYGYTVVPYPRRRVGKYLLQILTRTVPRYEMVFR